jgi:hypothetical protein
MAPNGDDAVNTEEQLDHENDSLARLRELVQLAQKGDYSVLDELKEALDANEAIWQQVGDLAQQSLAAWLQLLSQKDLLLHESVARKIEAMRVELTGDHPSPLVKLLVERVLSCWLQCHYADCLYAQATGPQVTQAARMELMKRQESAQRRYLHAIKNLSLVSKLLKPAISPLELAKRPVQEGPVYSRAGSSRGGLRLAEIS